MGAQMHLIGFFMNSPMSHAMLSWTDPADRQIEGLTSFAFWQELARTLERGCFDGAFFADTPGGFDRYRESFDDSIRYGVCWPCHDPLPVLGTMLAATRHLGVAATLSTSGHHPYTAVRALSTLDAMSGGRVGWNIVSGHLRGEHRALGLDQLDHDARYDRADEYMAACRALWKGIEPDAIVADRSTGFFADPTKVDVISFEGEHVRMRAIPPTLSSPQGRPVLFQAGSSGRGQQFAIDNADIIFAIQRDAEAMRSFVNQLADKAQQIDRADPPRVTFGVQIIQGDSEVQARERQQELNERVPIDGALSRMSGTLGIDFSGLDLEQPIEDMDTQASRGLMSVMASLTGDRKATVRDAARAFGASAGMPQIVGTPQSIADHLEHMWRTSGCHGFNITPATLPGSMVDFVDRVVPILQRRGLFRTAYRHDTFRDNLNDDAPETTA